MEKIDYLHRNVHPFLVEGWVSTVFGMLPIKYGEDPNEILENIRRSERESILNPDR